MRVLGYGEIFLMKLTKIGTAVDVLNKVAKERDYTLFKIKEKKVTLSNALEVLGLILLVLTLL